MLQLTLLSLLCDLLCGILFCDDHQLVSVSRCEEHPQATGGGDSAAQSAWTSLYFRTSLSRAVTHVIVGFRFIYFQLTLYPVFSWASWCAMGCKELSFKLPDCACMLYLCDATFNFAYKLNGVLHFVTNVFFL